MLPVRREATAAAAQGARERSPPVLPSPAVVAVEAKSAVMLPVRGEAAAPRGARECSPSVLPSAAAVAVGGEERGDAAGAARSPVRCFAMALYYIPSSTSSTGSGRERPAMSMRIERDSMGEIRVPAGSVLGSADPALAGELQDRRRAPAAAPDPGPGARQAVRGRGEPGVRRPPRRGRRGDPGRGPGGDRRAPGRPLSAGGLADRQRHPEQHERQRGDREPGRGAHGGTHSAPTAACIPTITSTARSRPTTSSRARSTSPSRWRPPSGCCRPWRGCGPPWNRRRGRSRTS